MIVKDFDLNDVFLMSEIVDRMDIEVEIDKYLNPGNIEIDVTGKTQEQIDYEADKLGRDMFLKVGLDLGVVFVKRMHRAKKEVIKLIANLTGKTIKEASELNLKEIKQFFTELIGKEGFKDFFSQAED